MLNTEPTKFTIYTKDKDDARYSSLTELIGRYFDGATITKGRGIWQGGFEYRLVVTILARHVDLQSVVNLAGDIKHVFAQSSVIVTAEPITRIDV